jgi:hypothetical protein
MENDHLEVNVLGKFSPVEEAILDHFRAHPDENIGTADLTRILKPADSTSERQQKAFDEIQDGIEALVVRKLVRGRRVSESGKVQYVGLRLTKKGESGAIKEHRRTKSITVTVNNVSIVE